MSKEKAGLYKCEATSEYGNSQSSAVVKFIGKYATISKVTIINVFPFIEEEKDEERFEESREEKREESMSSLRKESLETSRKEEGTKRKSVTIDENAVPEKQRAGANRVSKRSIVTH